MLSPWCRRSLVTPLQRRSSTHPDVIASHFHVAHRVAVVGRTSGETAVLADRHLFRIAVIESVLIMVQAAPGPHLLSPHQEVSRSGTGLLEMRLDVRLATRCIATKTHFLRLQRRPSPTQNAMQYGRSFLDVQHVELLYYVSQFDVFLQVGFLIVRVVALRAAHVGRVFGPGLADAAPAEVVFARQLHRLHEHMQTNGTNEFLLEAVPPGLRHLKQLIRHPVLSWSARERQTSSSSTVPTRFSSFSQLFRLDPGVRSVDEDHTSTEAPEKQLLIKPKHAKGAFLLLAKLVSNQIPQPGVKEGIWRSGFFFLTRETSKIYRQTIIIKRTLTNYGNILGRAKHDRKWQLI